MPNRFLNNITINDEYTLPSTDGDADQVIQTDGAGNLSFVDLSSIEGASSNFVYFEVKNETGSTINKGKGVMAVGTDGNSGHILIDEMVADGSVQPKYFLGVLETTVANGGFARVISFGQLDQFDTRGQNGETWADGQVLWCDPDSDGDFTITEPDGPNVKIAAAFILNSSTNGKIQIRVQANEGIKDLYDTKITSQVDGDVLVWDDATGVWFNDSTLNVDYTNSKVGIGTTSPSHTLDVDGGAQFNTNTGATPFYITRLGGTDQALSIKVMDDNVRFESIQDEAADSHGGFDFRMDGGTTEPNFTIRKNSAAPILHVDGSGKVGVGTTSPASKLHVNGNVTIGSIGTTSPQEPLMVKTTNVEYFPGIKVENYNSEVGLYIQNIDGYNSGVGTGRYYNSGFWRSDVTSPTSIRFDQGIIRFYAQSGVTADANYVASEKMRIDGSTGNVGIGTTSPSEKLEVDGNISVLGSFGRQAVYGSSNIKIGGGTASGDRFIDYVMDGNQQWRTGVDDTDGNKFGIAYKNGSSPTLGTDNLMTISSASGNVGIGTTSPSHKLHVEVDDTSTPALKIQSTNASNQAEIDFQTTGGTGKFELDQAGNMVFRVNQSNMYIDANNASAGIIFRTGGLTERLRINSSGNVGIGTTSPSQKLDVDGNVSFGSGNKFTTGVNALYGAGSNGIYLRSAISSAANPSFSNVDDTNTGMFLPGSDVLGLSTDGTERLRITSTGNVGIGATSPSEKLEVEGNVLADAFNTSASSAEISTIQSSSDIPLRVKSTDSFAGIDIKDSSTTASFQGLFAQGNNIGLRTSNVTRLQVNSGGSFTFSGNITSQSGGGHTITLYDNNASRNNRILMGADANGAFINSTYSSGGKGDLNLIAYNLGGVGIGKVSPKAKLDVNGGIRMADDSSSASADNVGTLRYRTSGNNSYVDMCMQTGASTYEWVNIVQNNW